MLTLFINVVISTIDISLPFRRSGHTHITGEEEDGGAGGGRRRAPLGRRGGGRRRRCGGNEEEGGGGYRLGMWG